MKKIRTTVYIDGQNLYHSIKELNRPELNWVNYWSLSESLLRKNEELIEVNYFTASPTWLPDQLVKFRVHMKALNHVGVNIIYGLFKDKFLQCPKCGRRYSTKEEKETDINIGLRLVTDGMRDLYDRAILISADTDLKAALETAQHLCEDKEIFVAAPQGRRNRARDLQPRYEIKPGRIANHLLDAEFKDSDGKVFITRPADYDPPSSN